MSPRITATSSLRNIYRNPARLTFVTVAAAVVLLAAVSSGVAAAGSAATARAATARVATARAATARAATARAATASGHSQAGHHHLAGPGYGTVQPSHRAAHSSACYSSQLHWWICHAEQVLRKHGTPQSALSTHAAFIVVQHESGGNPHAYNGWDANAAAGTPSEGIAQVIGPTFSTYSLPGYGNIWNPVDNMIAAFRYAISRYGSMNNIPGVVAVRGGGSYIGY